MLRQRILTGIVIAPLALAGVFLLPPFEFSIFIAAVLVVGAWEWANFAGLNQAYRYVYAVVIGMAMFGAAFLPPEPVLIASLVWWVAAFVFVVRYPALNSLWGAPVVVLAIGFLVLVPGWTALNEIKQLNNSSYLICLLFFLIWGADIGAYFSGKAFGQRKLAPRVSPGKSWEGFFGGLLTVAVIAMAMALWFGRPLVASGDWWIFLVASLIIGLISVLGDLSISMFKRHRDIKDSSNLLPGHGGFLDRIDSLLSASPVFALYLMSVDWL